MKPELDQVLQDKYPLIFPDRESRYYGSECGDGWFNIIDTMCSAIQSHIDHTNRVNPEDPVYQVMVTQVKEKFGGLRFYYVGGDDYCRGIVAMAEAMSYHVCEVCSDQASTFDDGGWIMTLCEKHRQEQIERREKIEKERANVSG